MTAVTKSSLANRLPVATIKDVVASSEAIHLVRKSKNGHKSRLQKMLDINTNATYFDFEMGPFASKIRIAYSKKLSKSDFADTIANKRIEYEVNVAYWADPDILVVEDNKHHCPLKGMHGTTLPSLLVYPLYLLPRTTRPAA